MLGVIENHSRDFRTNLRDGIWSATMGMPGLGRFIGSIIMKNFVTAKSEAKRLRDLLEHIQGLAIFIADENNVASWVKIGRAFQRFGTYSYKTWRKPRPPEYALRRS